MLKLRFAEAELPRPAVPKQSSDNYTHFLRKFPAIGFSITTFFPEGVKPQGTKVD
jgi:hypothetical protein